MKITRTPRAAFAAALTLAYACTALAAPAALAAPTAPAAPTGPAAPAVHSAPANSRAQAQTTSTTTQTTHTTQRTSRTSQQTTRTTQTSEADHGAGSGAPDNGRDRYAAERAPLDVAPATTRSTPKSSSSPSMTSTLVRTIVGLFIVIMVVYGLAWILRQFKRGREGRASGTGLSSVANLPLGPNRSLTLVRAGSDLLLIGVAEQGVTPIGRYSEEQARAAGLLPLRDELSDAIATDAGGTGGWRGTDDSNPVGWMLDAVRRWTVR